jgi:short-subunit dehydrogenase
MPDHVVITGASSGLGAALARGYSRPGVRVSLLGRDQTRLAEIAFDSRVRGAEVKVHSGDVSDAPGMESWLLDVDSLHPVDLVIANAGIGGSGALAHNSLETGDVARRILSTNVLGVVNTVTPLLPRFVARGHGHIAIVSSLAAFLGLPDCPAYSASKAAIRIYGDALRRLVVPHGVYVSVICPGFIDTPMSTSLPFRPPFLWDAERAAKHIANGLAHRRRQILFPWPISIAVLAVSMLPAVIADRILAGLRVGLYIPQSGDGFRKRKC